jgi:hypothetical protein
MEQKPYTGSLNSFGGKEQVIFWHRDLPPRNAEMIGEHALEATSCRVPGTLAHRDELRDQCYNDLKKQTQVRLRQELAHLGGHRAHIPDESIDSRHGLKSLPIEKAGGGRWL